MVNMTDECFELEAKDSEYCCQVCGSNNIYHLEYDHCDHYIQDHVECHDCGSVMWFQFYLTSCSIEQDGRFEEE